MLDALKNKVLEVEEVAFVEDMLLVAVTFWSVVELFCKLISKRYLRADGAFAPNAMFMLRIKRSVVDFI